MNEKVIIKGKAENTEILLKIGAVISLLIGVLYEWAVWEFDRTVSTWIGEIAYMSVAVFALFLIAYFAIRSCELTVTDKRVFGAAIFGKRVDLPLDSISAVGIGILKNIAISTASGHISFIGIKNRDEIHKVLSDLLIERQNKPSIASVVKQEVPQSNADELKKYKELLDSGAITQEEFDAKKKELLGL